MATLHILSHSPFGDSSLSSCLRLLGREDALLLSGDAVYALQPDSQGWQALHQIPSDIPLYALAEDLAARQLQAGERVQEVDYPAFVELCCHYAKVNSWL